MTEISVTQLKARLDAGNAPRIIDVRETWEYENDHIEAENIPLSLVPVRISELEDMKDKEIIMACRSGGRSGQACQFLAQQGFSKVMNLKGGMLAWKAEINPDFNVQ